MTFQKGQSGLELSGETKTWNVASHYSLYKIFLRLRELDKLEMIAQFGTEFIDVPEGQQLPMAMQKTKRRKEALYRILAELRMVIGNADFNIKVKDEEKIKIMKQRLDKISKSMNDITKKVSDERNASKEEVIHEENFNIILRALQDVKVKLNRPLNNCNFIFGPTEEVDLDKLQHELIEE